MDLMSMSPEMLAELPAMPAPFGMTSNFDYPQTNAKQIRVLNSVFTAAAVLSVIIRIYIRTTFPQGQKFGWDDTTCIIATLASIVHMVMVFLGLDAGYGRHLWDIRAITLTQKKLLMIASVDIVYVVAIFFVKVSILLYYHRLFRVYTSSRRLIYAGCAIITIIMLSTLATSIARAAQCTRVSAVQVELCSGRSLNIVLAVAGSLNAFTDFFILAIPLQRVIALQIQPRKKIGLLVIFLAGLLACSMSIVRLGIIGSHWHSPDVLYNSSRVTPFTIVELNLGILCMCMTFTPAFFRQSVNAALSIRTLISSSTSRSSAHSTDDTKVSNSESSDEIASKDGAELEVWERNVPDLELLSEQTQDRVLREG